MDPTHYAFLAAALLACLLWLMEMRTVQNLRDGHQERFIEMRKEHEAELRKVSHESWCAGVQACKEAMKKKRDALGRFAREETKAL